MSVNQSSRRRSHLSLPPGRVVPTEQSEVEDFAPVGHGVNIGATLRRLGRRRVAEGSACGRTTFITTRVKSVGGLLIRTLSLPAYRREA
jgi:hypothetical protein